MPQAEQRSPSSTRHVHHFPPPVISQLLGYALIIWPLEDYLDLLGAHRRELTELFVLHDGPVTEGGVANMGFFRGDRVVWPDAPMLHGITMHLLDERLHPSRKTIRLDDVLASTGPA